jgi:hypothetical protein
MSDRRPVGWYLGLILLALITITAAVVLTWISSDLQVQVYSFYNDNQGQEFAEADYQYWETISINSYTLLALATPLLVSGGVALVAMLAVLAFRWEQRQARGQADLDEATAAS